MSDAITAIQQLAIRYAQHRDAHELDALAALFAEDAICDFGADFGGVVTGAQAIRDFFAASMARNELGPWETLHLTGSHLVTLTGEGRAQGRSYLAGYSRRDAGAPLHSLIIYDDIYVERGGNWLFSQRRLNSVWPNFTPTTH